MKQRKYELFDTALYDYQYIQSHLTEMAAKGWRLDMISTLGFWRYRRSEPAHVRYEVTYAPSGSAYNSRPTVQEEILSDLCAEAGWVKVAALAQLHIYCNENPDATPLETDEPARIRNIRQSMKKSFVREQVLLIVLFLIQLHMQVSTLLRWPTRTLTSPLSAGNVLMIGCVALLFSVNLAAYFIWIRRAEKAVDAGLPCPGSSFYRKFRYVLWAFILAYIMILLCSAQLWFVGGALAIGFGNVLVTRGVMELCKKKGAPKWANIAIPFVVSVVLTAVPLTLLILSADSLSLDLTDAPAAEEAPLALRDFGLSEDRQTPEVMDSTDSFLGSYRRYWDETADGETRLRYTVTDMDLDPLYDLCQKEQEQDFMEQADWASNGEIILNQGQLWGAEYARHAPGDHNDRWLICWENRIVELYTSWPLTEEQIQIAAELLRPQGAAPANIAKAQPAPAE